MGCERIWVDENGGVCRGEIAPTGKLGETKEIKDRSGRLVRMRQLMNGDIRSTRTEIPELKPKSLWKLVKQLGQSEEFEGEVKRLAPWCFTEGKKRKTAVIEGLKEIRRLSTFDYDLLVQRFTTTSKI